VNRAVPGINGKALAAAIALAAVLALPGLARGQGAGAAVPPPPALPSVADVAAGLADPQRRDQVLLTMAALARLQARLQAGAGARIPALVEDLSNDREWTASLSDRFSPWQPHSPVLDTAAWRVLWQLEQYGLQPGTLSRPSGPGLDVFLEQLFARSNVRLAGSALPLVAWDLETSATLVWADLLARAADNAELASDLAARQDKLFAGWAGAAGTTPPRLTLEEAMQSLDVMANRALGYGPPDPGRLQTLRQALLGALPGFEGADQLVARNLLRMAELLSGLEDGQLFGFARGLLAIMADLDLAPEEQHEGVARLANWLAGVLPEISSSYAHAFAAVDPRLNSAVAAAYDVSMALGRAPGATQPAQIHDELADAVAKLALLIPDMAFYFDLPVRDPIAGGVDACTGIVAARDSDGSPSLTRELFDDCLETLTNLADNEARQPQLAGDSGGPFGYAQLQRELTLTSGQRINYGVGYLHQRYSTGCDMPVRALPNPLEWAYLATFMAWFADQSPVYFQTPENEQRLVRMQNIGQELVISTAEQVDCIAGAGADVNDPVVRVLADYRAQLAQLGQALREAEQQYRDRVLAPGADVALEGDASQSTAYRPSKLTIGPCDPKQVCEMTGQLSSTRALLGLFPEEYLVADQSGLGKAEICYDRVEWVDRRSTPVRPGDGNVANYFGHLAFDLKGRWVNQGEATDLFAFRFRSPEEYHYMFAAASQEVLDDSCPVEWIGSRIVTTLPERKTTLLPNRLTYLSAPRMLPSRLLNLNWDRGSEWRDWFVTGIGVDELPVPPAPDISEQINRHLRTLYRREQAVIYAGVLQSGPGAGRARDGTLADDVDRLSTSKELLRMQMMLFYPRVLSGSDELRGAMVGNDGLLERPVLRRFRDDSVPVAGITQTGYDRLEAFQDHWQALPEQLRRNGTLPTSLAQALMRLNSLYVRYFATPPVSEETLHSSPPPAAAEAEPSQEDAG